MELSQQFRPNEEVRPAQRIVEPLPDRLIKKKGPLNRQGH